MDGAGRASASDDNHNPLITSINRRLGGLSTPSNCCIFTVLRKLRQTHREAFSPKLVSIGPFYHGAQQEAMEEHKWRYLQSFLTRKPTTAGECVKAIEKWEDRIRQCYSENIHLSSDDLIRMVLVDGAFIIELFRLNHLPQMRAKNDIIFDERKPWMITNVRRDMSLMENQLPFFVLENLFKFPFETQSETPSLLKLAYKFFCVGVNIEAEQGNANIEANIEAEQGIETRSDPKVKHLLDALRFWHVPTPQKELQWKKIEAIPRAKQLQAAGVKFKMSKSNCLFNIEFSKGVLEIPCFKLNPVTESFLRNITAFEQSCYRHDSYFIDYVAFLGDLIKTRADVKLLIKKGIIATENLPGNEEILANNDEALANLFNSFEKESRFWTANIRFYDLQQRLKAYYETHWHRLKVHKKCNSVSKKKH